MKIFASNLPAEYLGLLRAVDQVGSLTIWDRKKLSAYDLFDIYQPELLLLTGYDLTDDLLEVLQEYNQVKTIMFDTRVIAGFKPDVVCSTPTLSNLRRRNLERAYAKIVYLKEYADLEFYCRGANLDQYQSDLFYFANNADDKRDLNKVSLLSTLGQKCRFKSVGPHPIPINEYLGLEKNSSIKDWIASTKAGIGFSGPELLGYASARTFFLSNLNNELFPVLQPNNLEEMLTLITKKEKQRKKIVTKAYEQVMANDTSYHRLIDIFAALDAPEIVSKAKEKLDESRDTN